MMSIVSRRLSNLTMSTYGRVIALMLVGYCGLPGVVAAQTQPQPKPKWVQPDAFKGNQALNQKGDEETRTLVDKLGQMLGVDSAKSGLSNGSGANGRLGDFEMLIDIGDQGTFEAGAFGPGEGGGGDPRAQQFIQMARRLAQFFHSNPDRVALPFDPVRFQSVVDQIDKSVKDESVRDLIFFTKRPLIDQQGTPKAAFFDRSNSTIVVSHEFWRRASAEEKLSLVTMEILGLLSVKDSRYELATSLLRDRAAAILSIPLPRDGGFVMPGMRIVGKDPDQFGRLTESDVVIDVGIVGRDPDATRRLAKFLDDPSSNKAWLNAVVRARRMRRPAYFLFSSPDASRVVVVATYDTRYEDGSPGMSAYGLMLAKRRQIYDGPCSGDARSIGIIERLRSCFLDMENYSANDFLINKKLGADEGADSAENLLGTLTRDLKKSLLWFFSQDLRTLQEVISAHFLQDYSTLVADPMRADIVVDTYRRLILDASARANRLAPQLEAPYSQIWFWGATKERDLPSDRFFAALQTLASNRLGFIDHMTVCGTEKGPKLLDLERLREYRFARACREEPTTHFPDLKQELYAEMVKLGFRYDARTREWKRGAAPGSLPQPVLGSVGWADSLAVELRTRFMTESLSSDAKLRVLRDAIASSGLEERFELYEAYLPRAWLLGFSQSQIDELFREAWREITRSPSWARKKKSFLGLTEISYGIAVSDRRLAKDVIQVFRDQMPDSPWFAQPHVFEAWNALTKRPDRVQIMSFVLDLTRGRTLDSKITEYLAFQISSPNPMFDRSVEGKRWDEMLSFRDRSALLKAIRRVHERAVVERSSVQ